MYGEFLNVACPVTTPSGKTAWIQVGRAFKGDVGNKYVMKLTLLALPVTALSGEPIELMVFKAQPHQQANISQGDNEPPPPTDADFPPWGEP